MKTLAAIAVMLAALVPAAALAQTNAFTGKWEGTFTLQRPDGTEDTNDLVLNLTQKGKELTGTGGVKGRLQGDMTGERDGVVRGKASVDAARAK